MSYCLYVRKSRADTEAEAHGEGETLSRHINTLTELAQKRHLDITQIHREIVSGETIAARPVMQQLLSEVEKGMWEGVLVMELERLARGDTVDQGIVAQTFKFSSTKIITPMKDYDPHNEFDEEYFEFGLFMSRREYKTINRRLQRGRLASVKEGKFVGSQAPYGYKRVKIEGDKGFTLEPLAEEADVVRIIFDWYTRGEEQSDGSFRRLGFSLIARRLNSLKISPRRSDSWSAATIRDILTNPVYIGKIRWNRRCEVKTMVKGRIITERTRNPTEKCIVVEGLHAPLVAIDVFNKAQEFMLHNSPRPVCERKTVKNPLAGIIICAKCGHRMTRRPYTGRDYPDTLMCTNSTCSNVSCALPYVERRILEALSDWLSLYRLQWETSENDKYETSAESIKEKALKRLVTEYNTLKKQLDNTYNLLELGVYTEEKFLERSRVIAGKIKTIEEKRSLLSADISANKSLEKKEKEIVPKIERLIDVYDELPTAKAKNDMLKEVLEKVVYLKTKNCRWSNVPDEFELTIYPKIPMCCD